MKKFLLVELVVLISAFFILWASLIILKIVPDDIEINIISVEQEKNIGRLVFDSFYDESDIISNPTLDSAISKISQRLIFGVGKSDYIYQIFVVRDKEINAFALPGGYIIIFSGLIEFTENPTELASIIAHEIGHIELSHVRERLIKEIGLTTSFLILVNDPNIISEVGRIIISTIFDRQQESEADEYSMKLITKCNLDPHSIGVFFKRLMEGEKDYSFLSEFLNTHPSIEKRIKKSLEYKTPDGFQEDSLQIDWDKVKLSFK
ncbi:MAG: M48 family metallopeptidase [Ignavibacteriales bacterium]|nr:M48 family metallopeptidase [Ignavibacteriales bacterium]